MKRIKPSLKLFMVILSFIFGGCEGQTPSKTNSKNSIKSNMETSYQKSEEEWKKILSPEAYQVLREKGTERPFTGKYNLHFEKGKYTCAGCGYELFNSDMKFESHCGWPSFDREIGDGSRIKKITDRSHGMIRTEIVCARCGGHLGHIFDDGPTATGMRYCVNSLSIDFLPADSTKK